MLKNKNTYKFLVLDDEKAELYFAENLIIEVFENSNHKIIIDTINSYEDAIKIFKKKGINYYDIIFIDISIDTSEKSGIDFLKYVKNKKREKPPVCGMLTVSTSNKDIQQSIESGCDFYMEKTEDIDIYIKSIELIKNIYLDKLYLDEFLIKTYLTYHK